MFKHFLLTRFNLRFDTWETTVKGAKVLSEEWLEDRFQLFETYCLPSVKNQVNQNFTWLIFYDINTPESFKSRITRLAREYANMQPVFIASGKEFRQSIIATLKASITDQFQFIITSRIDNDDLIHKDFIQTVQRLFEPIHNHVIVPRIGYQLIVDKGKCEVLKFKDNFNPFISLIESASDIQSVFSKDHREWKSAASVTNYEDTRLWMALIHKNNKYNMRKRLKGIYSLDSNDFGIAKDKLVLKSFPAIFLSNLMIELQSFKRSLAKKWKGWMYPFLLRKQY